MRLSEYPDYDASCQDCKAASKERGCYGGISCGLNMKQHKRVKKAKQQAEKDARELRCQELEATQYPGALITELYTRASGEVHNPS